MVYSGIIMSTRAVLAADNCQLIMCYVHDLASKLRPGKTYLETVNSAVKTFNPYLNVSYYDPGTDLESDEPSQEFMLRIDAQSIPYSTRAQ